MRLLAGCLAVLLSVVIPALAQDRAADQKIAFARAQHLKRGINVSHWFSQSPNDYSTHHTDTYTDADDIALMAKMGFDNVRLSIDAGLYCAARQGRGHHARRWLGGNHRLASRGLL
jgi:hypothetical protein